MAGSAPGTWLADLSIESGIWRVRYDAAVADRKAGRDLTWARNDLDEYVRAAAGLNPQEATR